MKIKVLLLTLVLSLTLIAQNATTTPAPKSDAKPAAACCGGHDMHAMKDGMKCDRDGKGCCAGMKDSAMKGKDGKAMACCAGMNDKDGKGCCAGMKDKDGKAMACCGGKDGKMKCDMTAHKDGKGCCGDKCPMHSGEHAEQGN